MQNFGGAGISGYTPDPTGRSGYTPAPAAIQGYQMNQVTPGGNSMMPSAGGNFQAPQGVSGLSVPAFNTGTGALNNMGSQMSSPAAMQGVHMAAPVNIAAPTNITAPASISTPSGMGTSTGSMAPMTQMRGIQQNNAPSPMNMPGNLMQH
jgi:hypothetical protein